MFLRPCLICIRHYVFHQVFDSVTGEIVASHRIETQTIEPKEGWVGFIENKPEKGGINNFMGQIRSYKNKYIWESEDTKGWISDPTKLQNLEESWTHQKRIGT